MRRSRRSRRPIQFDLVLPQAAQALEAELVRKNPDMHDLIDKIIEQDALKLAPRRADLEREAATIYAGTFSEDELKAIAAFYTSPAGQKLLAKGDEVSREVLKAADIWQRGIGRDLAQSVSDDLSKDYVNKAPAQAPQPAAGGSGKTGSGAAGK